MSNTPSSTASTTTTADSSSNDSSSNLHHQQHFVNERYPKTCLEDIPSIILEYPPRKFGNTSTRSRHSLRFRTQPVTLTEINETDEESKTENTDHHQQESQTRLLEDFQRLDHLTLSENIRRTARKKIPTKNYLERQRLKAMREEPSETDGN